MSLKKDLHSLSLFEASSWLLQPSQDLFQCFLPSLHLDPDCIDFQYKEGAFDSANLEHITPETFEQELLGLFSLHHLPSQVKAPPVNEVLTVNEALPVKDCAEPSIQTHKLPSEQTGPLTPEERRAKVEKFLEKRKHRTFRKKVAYQCRKRVADNRIRIKGRFVSKANAAVLFGPDFLSQYHPTDSKS